MSKPTATTIKSLDDAWPQGSVDQPVTRLVAMSRDDGEIALQDFLESAPIEVQDRLREVVSFSSFLGKVLSLSPYLQHLAKANPATVILCLDHGFDKALAITLAEASDALKHEADETKLGSMLRHLKADAALITGLADIGGWWSAMRVGEAMAETADLCVSLAVRHLLKSFHDRGKLALPEPNDPFLGCGYAVLAMGKHGARELNFSSDIDLIAIFDPDAAAIIDRDDSVALFVRLTKRLVKILQERTAEGYVFRTDLRLRPDPGAMPLAIPLPLALTYYEARGQNWERAALIKARAIAGDPETGREILDELGPFIWRRHLDYAAIADIQSIKRQIQSHGGHTAFAVAGHNVKLGLGGIREIEFFVQTQQLIAGGRTPTLRTKRTLDALRELERAGWTSAKARRELTESYHFLRDVEHRLQIVDDAQTHSLPEDDGQRRIISCLSGFESLANFDAAVLFHIERVHGHFADLFSEEDDLASREGTLSFTGNEDDPETVATLHRLGFENPSYVIGTVKKWHFGRYSSLQSREARERLNELVPILVDKLSDSHEPDRIFAAFDSFLEGLPAGLQFLSILQRNPRILELFLLVLGSAPRLRDVVMARPHVLDALLEIVQNTDHLEESYQEGISSTLDLAFSYEDGLDRARVFATEQRFLIGIKVLLGMIQTESAAGLFSELAEAVLLAMLDWVKMSFEEIHGKVPGSDFALLALGNFGSRELTATSDLDLVALYEYDSDRDTSTGRKPLHASQYFGRLTQRLIAALSAQTASGAAYELDLRLRPHGAKGPIATSLLAFEKHFESSAWTWERMALTRARVIPPSSAFSARIDAAICRAISASKKEPELSSDIMEMRALMDKERPASSHWDIKLAEGGLIDIEFLTQWCVLSGREVHGHKTNEVLQTLQKDALQNDNVNLGYAWSTFSRLMQLMRLCFGESRPPEDWPQPFKMLVLRSFDLPDIGVLEAELVQLQNAVRGVFMKMLSA